MNKKQKITIIVLIALFIILTILVKNNLLNQFENWMYYGITKNMNTNLTQIVKIITHIGDAVAVIAICLILFIVPKTRNKIAIPVLIVVVSSALLNIILKNIISRPRPNILRIVEETSFSFPSGHAMTNMTLYMMLILFTLKYISNKTLKYFIVITFTALITLIGISRVYLGVHYITDIIGGWLLGMFCAILVYALWIKYTEKNPLTK